MQNTKEQRMVVVPYRPELKFYALGGAVVAVMLSAALFWWLGYDSGRGIQSELLVELDGLRQGSEKSALKIAALEQELVNMRQGARVDRDSAEHVRGTLLEREARIAELEEEIGFYRNLMAPTATENGLSIRTLSLQPTNDTRVFEYRLVVQQLAKKHNLLKGSLRVDIRGMQNGEPAILSLKELSEQVNDAQIRLRFKYFQNIEGELRLPEGFEPVGIDISARSTAPQAAHIEKHFEWLVQEV